MILTTGLRTSPFHQGQVTASITFSSWNKQPFRMVIELPESNLARSKVMQQLQIFLTILNRPVTIPLWSFFGTMAGLVFLSAQFVILDTQNNLMETKLLQVLERLEAVEEAAEQQDLL